MYWATVYYRIAAIRIRFANYPTNKGRTATRFSSTDIIAADEYTVRRFFLIPGADGDRVAADFVAVAEDDGVVRIFSNRVAVAVDIGQRALYGIGIADRVGALAGYNDFRADGYRFLPGCTATVIVIEVYLFIDIRILLNVRFLHVCVFGAIKMEATARGFFQLTDRSNIRVGCTIGYIGDATIPRVATFFTVTDRYIRLWSCLTRDCGSSHFRSCARGQRVRTDGDITMF